MLGSLRVWKPFLDRRRIGFLESAEWVELRARGSGIRYQRLLPGQEPVPGDQCYGQEDEPGFVAGGGDTACGTGSGHQDIVLQSQESGQEGFDDKMLLLF